MTLTRRELHRCMKLAYAKGMAAGEARVLKGLSAIGHLNGAAPAVMKAGRLDTTTIESGKPTPEATTLDPPPIVKAAPRKPDSATRAAALLAWAAECEATGTDPTSGFDAILGDTEDVVEKATHDVSDEPRDEAGKWAKKATDYRAKATRHRAAAAVHRDKAEQHREAARAIVPPHLANDLATVERLHARTDDPLDTANATTNLLAADVERAGIHPGPVRLFGHHASSARLESGYAAEADAKSWAATRRADPAGAATTLRAARTLAKMADAASTYLGENSTGPLGELDAALAAVDAKTPTLEQFQAVATTAAVVAGGVELPPNFTPRDAKLIRWFASRAAQHAASWPLGGDETVVDKAWQPHLHPRSRDGRFIGRDRLQAAHANPSGREAKQLRKDVKPEDRAKLEAVLSQGLDAVGRTQRGESKHRAQAKRTARALTKSAAMHLVQTLADGKGTAEDVRALADHLKATWAEGGLSKDHLDLLQNVLGGSGRKRQEMVESLLVVARQATEPKVETPTNADREEAMGLAHRQRQNADRQDREGIDPRPPLPADDRDAERYDAARDKLSRMRGWAADKPHSLAAQEAAGRAAGRVEGVKQLAVGGMPAVSAGQPKEAELTVNPKESPGPRSAAQAAEEPALPPPTPPGMTPSEHRAKVKQARTAARTAELARRKDAGAKREAERVAEQTPAEAPGLTTAKKELAAATPDSLTHRALDAAVDNIDAMPADRYRDETPDRAALRHNRDVAGHLTSAWAAAHRLGAKPEELAPIERAMHAHGMEPVGTAGETVPHDATHHDVGPDAGGSPPSSTPVTVGRPGWHLREPDGGIYQTARAHVVKPAGNPLTPGGIASAMHRDATAFTASAPPLPAPDLAKRREQLSAGIGRMNLPEPVKADLHARLAAATTSRQQAAIHTEALARLEGRSRSH